MNKLVLTQLKTGSEGITPAFGECLAQAASICLEEQNHRSGIKLSIDGDYDDEFAVCWEKATEQMKRCWADLEVTTEHGAYGLAALLIPVLTDYEVVERSRKGTGFDYWLGRKEESYPLFQQKARLEVSGIRCGDASILTARVNKKVKQVKLSDGTTLPAYIVVVEFSEPRSRVVDKWKK
jgi:hypothetical protein